MTIVPLHCPRCGQAQMQNFAQHMRCKKGMDLEPPRYCIMCGRRMKVQVLPTGWRAECVEHGASSSVPS
jgi:hypothetical protein